MAGQSSPQQQGGDNSLAPFWIVAAIFIFAWDTPGTSDTIVAGDGQMFVLQFPINYRNNGKGIAFSRKHGHTTSFELSCDECIQCKTPAGLLGNTGYLTLVAGQRSSTEEHRKKNRVVSKKPERRA